MNLRRKFSGPFARCIEFFIAIEFLMTIVWIVGGAKIYRPYEEPSLSPPLYCVLGPIGSWLEYYGLLTSFPPLALLIAFVINPSLYGLFLYPVVRAVGAMNGRNEIPSLRQKD